MANSESLHENGAALDEVIETIPTRDIFSHLGEFLAYGVSKEKIIDRLMHTDE